MNSRSKNSAAVLIFGLTMFVLAACHPIPDPPADAGGLTPQQQINSGAYGSMAGMMLGSFNDDPFGPYALTQDSPWRLWRMQHGYTY